MGGNVKFIRVWDATREIALQVGPLLSLAYLYTDEDDRTYLREPTRV